MEGRFVNFRRHPCGCITKFDLIDWRSIAERRCAEHTVHEASPVAGQFGGSVRQEPGEPNRTTGDQP